jgi:hypothetical protein
MGHWWEEAAMEPPKLEKPKEEKKPSRVLHNSGVIIALITGIVSIVTTYQTTHQANADLKDSFNVMAHDLNTVSTRVAKMEGKMELQAQWQALHVQKAASEAQHILKLDEVSIEGHVGTHGGSSTGTSIPNAFKPTASPTPQPTPVAAAPTASPATLIPENLDDALKMKRSEK